ncbi:MAG TPA: 3-methyl-2-oxobutanoate hydroxymethyltransferase, partial [Gemmatimonadaceae bacterium]|nr:3-methyl-2-oxobutanoate hydroxymethyltransferase [Gemmatimonadaceae bacterium]
MSDTKPVTIRDLVAKKGSEKIVMVTAYDALFARIVDEAGVDAILVGDSLGNVVAGLDSTLGVTLDQMIYHATAARRGCKRALLVVDLPFMSYQVSTEDAMRSAGRVMQTTGAQAVKLEGGTEARADAV